MLARAARRGSVGLVPEPARARPSTRSVSPYRDEIGNWRSMHPDFIFFHEVDGAVRPSIVDPHGHHLEDAYVKLKGLAEFADKFGDEFHRIEALTKLPSGWRILDLKLEPVRAAVLAGGRSPIEFYESDIAVEYDI